MTLPLTYRAWNDHIPDFEPFSFGIMRDAQSVKPQSLRTGDRWFALNLATNPTRVE